MNDKQLKEIYLMLAGMAVSGAQNIKVLAVVLSRIEQAIEEYRPENEEKEEK